MPIFLQPQADQDPQIELQAQWDGGVVTRDEPDVLPDNAVQMLVNMDIHQQGKVKSRYGARHLWDGDGTPIRALGDVWLGTDHYWVAASGTAVYLATLVDEVEPSVWVQQTAVTLDVNAERVIIFAGGGYLFVTDGTHVWRKSKDIDWTDLTWHYISLPLDLPFDLPDSIVERRIPNVCKHWLWRTDRMFAAGHPDFPDTLFVSDFLDPVTWDSIAQVKRIGAGDGQRITGISGWQRNQVVVFKERSIYVVNADPAQTVGEWVVETVCENIGCNSPRSIIGNSQDVVFASREGVRSIRRAIEQMTNSVSLPFSDPVDTLWRAARNSRVKEVEAILFDNRILITLPSQNQVLVYDTLRAAWAGIWQGWQALAFCAARRNSAEYLLIGTAEGRILLWTQTEDHADAYDNEVQIESSLLTREYQLNEPMSEKMGLHAEVLFGECDGWIQIYAIRDGSEPELLWQGNLTGARPAPVRVDLYSPQPFRNVALRIQGTRIMTVKKVMLLGFVEPLEWELTTSEGGP